MVDRFTAQARRTRNKVDRMSDEMTPFGWAYVDPRLHAALLTHLAQVPTLIV